MAKKKKNKLRKKKRTGTYNKKKLKNAILSTLYEDPGKTVNYRQVSGSLGINDEETRKLINVVLQELSEDGYLDEISRGKYRLNVITSYSIHYTKLYESVLNENFNGVFRVSSVR